mmetsp:Transcript_36696/g.105694  ORF Transcript_36696/g.105694 Transcript_36696/m.105694 type:complete len:233 (+) Transcript_36696:344-1042(+)
MCLCGGNGRRRLHSPRDFRPAGGYGVKRGSCSSLAAEAVEARNCSPDKSSQAHVRVAPASAAVRRAISSALMPFVSSRFRRTSQTLARNSSTSCMCLLRADRVSTSSESSAPASATSRSNSRRSSSEASRAEGATGTSQLKASGETPPPRAQSRYRRSSSKASLILRNVSSSTCNASSNSPTQRKRDPKQKTLSMSIPSSSSVSAVTDAALRSGAVRETRSSHAASARLARP